MNELVHDIIQYVNLLKKDYELGVSFIYDHFPQKHFEMLFPCIAHQNKYCEYYKKSNLKACVQDKHALLERKISRPFVGRCHAGVLQWIFPVKADNKTVNIVTVAEHKSACPPDFDKLCGSFNMSPKQLRHKYNLLASSRPKLSDLNAKIQPLVHMLELYYMYYKDLENSQDATFSAERELYNKLTSYIMYNFKDQLTLSDVCQQFNYSSTFLNCLFKKYRKMTIKQYIIFLKLKQASHFLLTTDMSISEIAQELGYNDSNYFTNQFKKFYKLSPRTYRKKQV